MNEEAVIYIPEDNLRNMFSLLLADSCVRLASCPDLDEVLRVLGSRFCKLCILTHESGLNMAEVITEVHTASPDTKIIVIANREDAAAVLPLFQKGLNDVILRPINPKHAINSIRSLLGKTNSVSLPANGGTNPPFGATNPTGVSTNPPFGSGQNEGPYKPVHLIARSETMRKAVNELWAARKNPIGVILRGEPGSEFELAVREFQAMNGDPHGYAVIIPHHELNVETLATQVSLDSLSEGIPKTYFVPEVEKLSKLQAKDLLDFLRRERRGRSTAKPLRMVFSATHIEGASVHPEAEIIEALQFIMPTAVNIPPIRDRSEDVELIVRRILMDLTAIFPAYRARSFHPAALQWLCARPWPGNYNELLTAMRGAVLNCGNREINAGHFGQLTGTQSATPFDLDEVAATRVLDAVQRASSR